MSHFSSISCDLKSGPCSTGRSSGTLKLHTHAAWFVGKFAAVFLAERSTQLAVGHRNLGAASGADPSEGIGSAIQHPYAKRVFVRLQPPNLRRVGRRRCYGMPPPQPIKKSPQRVT